MTGTGPGATATTVVQVGGYSSTNVAAGATLANAATNANTASTIVKRDASGNFSAGTGSFTSLTSSGSISTGTGAKIATLSPSAISTSYTWTLPSAVASSNGQMLTSDTSGNLSWVTPAAGSQWTTQAPGINYMGGNVGIGTTSPRGALEIDGADGTMYVRNTNSSGYAGMNMFDDTNTLTGSFQIGGSAASVGAGSLFIGPRKAGGNLMFVRGVGATESARIDSNGRFGIGTSSPVGAMDVSTASGTTEFNLRSAGLNHGMTGVVSSTDIGLQLSTSSNGGGFLGGFSNFQNTSGLSFFAVSNAPNAGIPAIEFRAYKKSGVGIAPLDPGDTAMKLSSGPSTLMTVMGSGNVGIGTTMPNSKLEVGGTIISTPNVTASGATLDMSKSNLQTITSATSSAITLNNLVNGGNYTIVIKDATSRTYTFPGCTTQKFLPANTATTASSWSMYTILSLDNGGGGFDCMITWATGYQ